MFSVNGSNSNHSTLSTNSVAKNSQRSSSSSNDLGNLASAANGVAALTLTNLPVPQFVYVTPQRINITSSQSHQEFSETSEQQQEKDAHFLHAAKEGNLASLDLLLQAGANLNVTNIDGDSAMHLAIRHGHINVISRLIEWGVDTHVQIQNPLFSFLTATDNWSNSGHSDGFASREQMYALAYAALHGQIEVMNFFSSQGTQSDQKNDERETAKLFAVLGGHLDVLKMLIDEDGVQKPVQDDDSSICNALINIAAAKGDLEIMLYLFGKGFLYDQNTFIAAADRGQTHILDLLVAIDPVFADRLSGEMLFHASAKGQAQFILKLLKHNFSTQNLYSGDYLGRTVLHGAAWGGHVDLLNVFVDFNKVNLNLASKVYKETALHIAARKGHLDVVNRLIQLHADISLTDSCGRTALLLAAKKGHLNVIKRLLDCGADSEATDEFGNNVLLIAAEEGRHDVVSHFCNLGFDINSIDKFGRSALHHAAENGNLQLVKFLVAKGIHTHLISTNGLTALHTAFLNDHLTIANYLIKHGASINPSDQNSQFVLFEVIEKGNIKTLKRLTELGFDLNSCNEKQNSLLHIAVIEKRIEMVGFLINAGLDINAVNSNLNTPLHLAARLDQPIILKHLIGAKANLNKVDNHGNTALHIASECGLTENLVLLIKAGAEINKANNDGETVLHCRLFSLDWAEVITVLVDAGANIEAVQNTGETPLINAAKFGHINKLNVLIDKGANIFATASRGRTALHFAANRGQHQVTERLIQLGSVIVNQTDAFACKAFHHAAINGHLEISNLLIRAGTTLTEDDLTFINANIQPERQVQIRQQLLNAIQENKYSEASDLSLQFPTMINEDDFRLSIAIRRGAVGNELVRRAKLITNTLKQVANVEQSGIPVTISDEFARIGQYATQYPVEDLGTLLFPEHPEQERAARVNRFFEARYLNRPTF